MNTFQKVSLFLLRISFGWLFLYAGFSKVMDPAWTAKGYLMGAKTFTGFYQWLGGSGLLGTVDVINAWGQVVIGIALILGIFVRWSAIAGAVMMLLYYFPILQFPYPNAHAYIVDEHIIYLFGLLVLAAWRAGDAWGLGKKMPAWMR